MGTHANMTNVSMPPGIIIPVLVYKDVETAVAWLCSTFGFKERLRIGNHRAQLTFGAASLVVTSYNTNDAYPTHFGSHSIMVRITDIDQHFAHVKKREAHIILPPQTHIYGERQYTVEDIGGHRWTFTQSVANVVPDEWGGKLITQQDDNS